MVKKQKIILFDIDNTLLNGDIYREKMFRALAHAAKQEDKETFKKRASEEYFAMRRAGPFLPREFAEVIIKKLHLSVFPQDLEQTMFDQDMMTTSLFEEAKEVLESLSQKKDLILGVFSSGPYEFQRAKIRAIENLFQKDHINIYLFKEEALKPLIQKYRNYELYFVDDLLSILYNASRISNNVYTIWIKRGWVAREQKPIEGFSPDKTIINLREILPLFL